MLQQMVTQRVAHKINYYTHCATLLPHPHPRIAHHRTSASESARSGLAGGAARAARRPPP
eukprot:scaffold12829_cov116-Isochrysis_galbana.AAC.17